MRAERALLRALLAAVLFSTGPRPARAHGFSAEATLLGHGYVTGDPERDPDAIGWLTLSARQEWRLGETWLRIGARAEVASADQLGPVKLDPAEHELRRSPLALRELVLRVPLARAVDLHLGRQFLGWGKTDGYSPADAFLPRDWTDPFGDEKLPLWGARVTGQSGPVRLDAFGAAVHTPWRLPVLSGRFAPLPTGDAYIVDGANALPTPAFGALRVLGTFGDWDVGTWGRYGNRPAPLLEFRPDLAELRPDGIAVPADRSHASEGGFGLEASRVTGAWVLRAEAGALWSDAPDLGDALLVAAGAERGFGDATLLVTFAANLRDTPVDPALLFDRAFLPGLIVAWSRNQDWGAWKAVYSHGFDHGDGLLKVEARYDLDDRWSIGGGIDWPRGPREGPFGALRDARRAWSALKRRW